MGKKSLWICDRCGAEEQSVEWPSEWGKLVDKERGYVGETKSEMVCSDCRESFWQWYQQTNAGQRGNEDEPKLEGQTVFKGPRLLPRLEEWFDG